MSLIGTYGIWKLYNENTIRVIVVTHAVKVLYVAFKNAQGIWKCNYLRKHF